MPTASLAEGEDAPSGDFTVNVYADLEAFGDPCEIGPGSASMTLDMQENWDSQIVNDSAVVLGNVDVYNGTDSPSLVDLIDYYSLNPEHLPHSQVILDGDGNFLSVEYDAETSVGALFWDAEPLGILDQTEVDLHSVILAEDRRSIHTLPYTVSFEADSCDSQILGVMTVARSPVLYYENESDPGVDIEVLEISESTDLDSLGNAWLRVVDAEVFVDDYDSEREYPLLLPSTSRAAVYPLGEQEGGGITPMYVRSSGEQDYAATMNIFGDSPAGEYSVMYYHNLYVDNPEFFSWACSLGLCSGG
jgi:hypothetical protein